MSNKTTNQSGGGGDKPKRIDQYMGGKQKVPKPKKMSEADAITAASAVIDKASAKVKEVKTVFDLQVEQAKTMIDKFSAAASKVPSHVDARLDTESSERMVKLEKVILNADFSSAMAKAVNQATSGWLGEHKITAWCVVIVSLLLMIMFGGMAINSSVRQGRAEEAAAQYQRQAAVNEQDAQHWRQFKANNPKTARRFLQSMQGN